MAQKQSGSKKGKGKRNRKWGRNRNFCLRYQNENRKERNKKRKLQRHLKKFPDDAQARRALRDL